MLDLYTGVQIIVGSIVGFALLVGVLLLAVFGLIAVYDLLAYAIETAIRKAANKW